MPGTRRIPLHRAADQPMISPRALELFAAAERARRARLHADDCTVAESGYCTTDCRACEAWWAAHNAITRELRLDPWLWPAVPCCPFPPGSAGAREWRPDTEAKTLYDALVAARRAAAAARADAKKYEEDPNDVEPVADAEEPRI
jgi:hypothetical protein